jgi:hypothetical protein
VIWNIGRIIYQMEEKRKIMEHNGQWIGGALVQSCEESNWNLDYTFLCLGKGRKEKRKSDRGESSLRLLLLS